MIQICEYCGEEYDDNYERHGCPEDLQIREDLENEMDE